MHTSADILGTYATLSGLMGSMLAAARDGNWDRLIELEQDCAEPIDRLKAGTGIRLSRDEQHQKLDYLKRILKDDAAIRDLTLPRLAHLGRLIGDTQQGRRSVAAYR